MGCRHATRKHTQKHIPCFNVLNRQKPGIIIEIIGIEIQTFPMSKTFSHAQKRGTFLLLWLARVSCRKIPDDLIFCTAERFRYPYFGFCRQTANFPARGPLDYCQGFYYFSGMPIINSLYYALVPGVKWALCHYARRWNSPHGDLLVACLPSIVGFVFCSGRDFAQRRIGHWSFSGAMLAGCAISWRDGQPRPCR